MKKLFFLVLFCLSQSAMASGAFVCSYELREYHGGAYSVLGTISNPTPDCGQAYANQNAHDRCQRLVIPPAGQPQIRQCIFKGCQEDPFISCSSNMSRSNHDMPPGNTWCADNSGYTNTGVGIKLMWNCTNYHMFCRESRNFWDNQWWTTAGCSYK